MGEKDGGKVLSTFANIRKIIYIVSYKKNNHRNYIIHIACCVVHTELYPTISLTTVFSSPLLLCCCGQ